jgi:hypothetical protein
MSLELNTVLGIPKTVNTFYVSLRVPPPNGFPRQGVSRLPQAQCHSGRAERRRSGGTGGFDEPPDIDSEPARSY